MEAQENDIIEVFNKPLSKILYKMNKEANVRNTKQIRKDIDEIIQKTKTLNGCRETSIARTKLQEAVMWLGMNLKQLGEADPYPESRNPESQTIHPTADGLKL